MAVSYTHLFGGPVLAEHPPVLLRLMFGSAALPRLVKGLEDEKGYALVVQPAQSFSQIRGL